MDKGRACLVHGQPFLSTEGHCFSNFSFSLTINSLPSTGSFLSKHKQIVVYPPKITSNLLKKKSNSLYLPFELLSHLFHAFYSKTLQQCCLLCSLPFYSFYVFFNSLYSDLHSHYAFETAFDTTWHIHSFNNASNKDFEHLLYVTCLPRQ